jgi:hypothetical protein
MIDKSKKEGFDGLESLHKLHLHVNELRLLMCFFLGLCFHC